MLVWKIVMRQQGLVVVVVLLDDFCFFIIFSHSFVS